jgi:hypothetical protein
MITAVGSSLGTATQRRRRGADERGVMTTRDRRTMMHNNSRKSIIRRSIRNILIGAVSKL